MTGLSQIQDWYDRYIKIWFLEALKEHRGNIIDLENTTSVEQVRAIIFNPTHTVSLEDIIKKKPKLNRAGRL